MSPATASRAYTRELLGAMAAYVVTVLVSIKLLQSGVDPALRIPPALLPIAPATLAPLAYLPFLGPRDTRAPLTPLPAPAHALRLVTCCCPVVRHRRTVRGRPADRRTTSPQSRRRPRRRTALRGGG